jgi:hypothetical protein
MAQLKQESEAAKEALDNWSQSADQSLTTVKGAADQAQLALQQMTDELTRDGQTMAQYLDTLYAKIDAINNPVRKGGTNQPTESYQGGTRLPGSREEVSFGIRYLVSPDGHRVPLGEHGELPGNWFQMYTGESNFAEAFSPIQVPISARSNTGQVNVQSGAVQMNFPVMNDATAMNQLAGIVGDAIMAKITRTGTVV